MFKRIFLQDTDNYKYWIIIAIIVKALFFFFAISENRAVTDTNIIHVTAGDSRTYIEPIENFIKEGNYYPDYRMPGYGIIYLLFRLIFPRVASLNLLVLLQLFLSAISVYVLALTCKEVFKSSRFFYASFYAYLLSTYVSIFDIYILTESFAVSFLIFSVFYFVKAVNKFNYTALFLSGVFLAWCIFLRPVSFLLLAIFIFILAVVWIRNYRYSFSRILKGILIFLLAFLLIDGMWTARNYKIYGEFIPLQKKIVYKEYENDPILRGLFWFGKTWGGDFSWWNPNAEINWFEHKDNSQNIKNQIKDALFPKCIYTSKFNYQSLLTVKDYIRLSKDNTLQEDERNKYALLAAERLNEYTDSIKKEKPFVYYIYAPLRFFRKFLFHSGTYNLLNKPHTDANIIKLIFKILMSLVYLLVVIGGLLGILILCLKNYMINNRLLIAILALYFSTIFPFFFRYCEYRFFAPGYPFMLVCAIYFITLVYDRLKLRRAQQ